MWDLIFWSDSLTLFSRTIYMQCWRELSTWRIVTFITCYYWIHILTYLYYTFIYWYDAHKLVFCNTVATNNIMGINLEILANVKKKYFSIYKYSPVFEDIENELKTLKSCVCIALHCILMNEISNVILYNWTNQVIVRQEKLFSISVFYVKKMHLYYMTILYK